MIDIRIKNGDNVSHVELQDGDELTIKYKKGALSVSQCNVNGRSMNIAQGRGCIAKQTNITQQTISGDGNVTSATGNVFHNVFRRK